MKAAEAAARAVQIRDSVHTAVVGRDVAVDQILVGLLADGHILLEDLPGLGKTLMAKSFARALGLEFQRVQFTADLLPHDITGGEILDPRRPTFVFRPGPLFTNLLLADEINRAPPKVQSALLEAMQEYQVTSERTTYPLAAPVPRPRDREPDRARGDLPAPRSPGGPVPLATQGRLSDRRGGTDDPRAAERPQDRGGRRLPPVMDAATFQELQRAVEDVELDPSLADYLLTLVRSTRDDSRTEVGASPRGSLALQKVARARALLSGRDYVVPDDIKGLAIPALAHRIVVKPEPWIRGVRGEDIVRGVVERAVVPKVK